MTTKNISVHRTGRVERIGDSVNVLGETWHINPVDAPFPLMIVLCGYSKWTKGHIINRETYSRFGIELVTAGNLLFYSNGNKFLVEPGGVIIKVPGLPHRYETGPAGFVHKRFLTIHGPGLASMLEMLNISTASVVQLSAPATFSNICKEAMRIATQQHGEYAFELSLLAYRAMLLISRQGQTHSYPPHVRAILDFFQRNIEGTCSMQQALEYTTVSATQLNRDFNRLLGEPPLRYFRHQKLQKACDLLLNTPLSIKRIADLLGYQNAFFFSRQFKAFSGMSPRKYRVHKSQKYRIDSQKK